MYQDPLPHWDLSNVFPGPDSPEFHEAVARLCCCLDDLDHFLADRQIRRQGPFSTDPVPLAETVAGFLDRMNGVLLQLGTARSYLEAFVSTDSYNTTARRLMSELDPLVVRAERQELLFRGWIGGVAAEPGLLAAVAQVPGPCREHAFFLSESAEQSRYLMSDAEEALAADLGLSGATAWQKLQGVVCSQMKGRIERGDGLEDLPITVIQNLGSDPEEAVRRRAYEAEQAAWRSAREPLAACLNGVKGTVNTLYRRRGRSDALHSALDLARIDRETLETLLAAMRASFPLFRRYWQAKAGLLGKDLLPWWDLNAPAGSADRRYTYTEARELLTEQFGSYSGRLSTFARRAFGNRWIDAEPRSGKRGGAFCMRIPAVEESRVFCNFDGSLDQVFTLAHELGHAYHNECQVGKTPLQRKTPMTLAETASIFCETIVTNAALAHAASPDEELAILETFLIGTSGVIVDIYARFLFEKEVFERRASAELSADDLCEIMVRCQQEAYGDALDGRYLNPYQWAWKPHYYRPGLSFYNFPYAFGLLFGLGLYTLYQERGAVFLAEYDGLLRSTGEATAAELAARFGIDLRQSGFWAGSLAVVEGRVERYVKLAAKARPL